MIYPERNHGLLNSTAPKAQGVPKEQLAIQCDMIVCQRER